jgi:hypothetical protein
MRNNARVSPENVKKQNVQGSGAESRGLIHGKNDY